MIMNELEIKIIDIIKGNIQTSKNLECGDNLKLIGVNSIIFIKIIVELESEFEIEFEDDELDLEKFTYINDLVNIVKKNKLISK